MTSRISFQGGNISGKRNLRTLLGQHNEGQYSTIQPGTESLHVQPARAQVIAGFNHPRQVPEKSACHPLDPCNLTARVFFDFLGGQISKRTSNPTVKPRSRAKLQQRPVSLRPARGYSRLWILFGLLLSAGGIAATALWLPEGVWPLSMPDQTQSVAPAPEKEPHRTPNLGFLTAKATINQPLPLGIVLNDGSGEETLVFSGFIEGTSLSAGTALTATRWSLPGRDLDKAFISAPENFEGVMVVTVTLYSSRQDILETKEARFEWKLSGKADKLPMTMVPDQRP